MNIFNRLFRSNHSSLIKKTFEVQVSEEDIYYAYRLLLQRPPDSNGWRDWNKFRDKLTLPRLVESFISSPEFQNRFLARSLPELVTLDDFKIFVHPNDWPIGAAIYQNHTYEAHVTKIIRSLLKPGMTFLDIGANVGYYTLLAASAVGPSGQVIAFEPNPDSCGLIYISLYTNQFNKIVTLYPFAVSDRAELLALEATGSNGSTVKIGNASNTTSLLVQSVVLDDMLENVQQVDILKIDIEGAEAIAWRGMRKLIERTKPTMFTEFFPRLLKTVSGIEAEDYLNNLREFGHSIGIIPRDRQVIPPPLTNEQIIAYWQSQGDPENDFLDLLVVPG